MSELSEARGLAEWVPVALAESAPLVTVVGDVILDGWWSGSIERFCREAPAPVVDVQRREYAPGGAANTAMNLAALGARVRLVGLVGNDDAGGRLRSLLDDAGVDTSALLATDGIRTTTKYRIIGGDQVMLRLDDRDGTPTAAAIAALAAAVPDALAGSAAVVVCDYGSGALETSVRKALATHIGEALTVVDAHDPRPWAELAPDIVTPNAQEAARLLNASFSGVRDRSGVVTERCGELFDATGAGAVVVTLDRDGTVLLSADGQGHRTWARPASEKQASGAGDTFVACLTAARAAGMPMTTSLDLAQAAADVVVGRPGTSVCSTADLTEYLGGLSAAALSLDELLRRVAEHRDQGRRIVLTNGCFDVLHRGHTRYLTQAKQLGDVLVVALNGDESVRRLKGADRPINGIADRAGVIASLSCVDFVTVFDTDTPVPLIEALRPDIYAKGGDYSSQMLEEAPVVERFGGVVRILDYVPEHSTTAVVEKIRTLPSAAS
ncbi:rfaE bifunctional protein kinase chain/domain/rfaE bifunctional protein nucleotidyltransferase chain/domain [Arthrobacter pigmenti]|uniref:D-glycero-beta-D-manno-heptose 1-phosphate adenylyltransferase n=1 Tax=Arthrobacter pigmenti TaxID=271432 RepID=A0A846RNI3_9MICC|nr:D-glycero-beta-D-manno-heptose 1-phosphate adenylyltransferase [Arthrobacter pigmenti]NJC21365.1 rfaE bifunctional protein kinase chain/domain/rfaE bifunctional protein nucleotidyltransferase chain/domain [Arthrobacter pigmenti]